MFELKRESYEAISVAMQVTITNMQKLETNYKVHFLGDAAKNFLAKTSLEMQNEKKCKSTKYTRPQIDGLKN